jgi:hypothetical protein
MGTAIISSRPGVQLSGQSDATLGPVLDLIWLSRLAIIHGATISR